MKKMKKATIVGCCLVVWICGVCCADDSILRKIKAVATDSPPKIDGTLNDSCWQKAAQSRGFVQYGPLPGEPASHATTVYLVYDRNRLYVGFECFKDDMNRLAANSTRRDARFFSDDYVEVFWIRT